MEEDPIVLEPEETRPSEGKMEEEEQATEDERANDVQEMTTFTEQMQLDAEAWSAEQQRQQRTIDTDSNTTRVLASDSALPDKRPRGITELTEKLDELVSNTKTLQVQAAAATRSVKARIFGFIGAMLLSAVTGAVIDRLGEFLLRELGVIKEDPKEPRFANTVLASNDTSEDFSLRPVLALDDERFWKRVQRYASALNASLTAQAALMRVIVGLTVDDAPTLEWDAESKLAAIDQLRRVLTKTPQDSPPSVSLIYAEVPKLQYQGKPLPRALQAHLCEIVLANVTSATT